MVTITTTIAIIYFITVMIMPVLLFFRWVRAVTVPVT